MRSRFLFTLSAVMLAGTMLTACGGGKAAKTATETPRSPYATGNYPGILKIGTPYDIAGRTYYPAHDPGYVEEGIASWYGPGFHGRSTANGERYDQNGLTAAHRTLPMPSMVRVTNLENGRTEVLKVNDRGPFAKDRIIDLSKKSAERLGVIGKGTARVRVEYLPDETRQLIADLMRNNQIKADQATLTMLAMNDLEYGGVTSDASPGLGIISSANAAATVHGGSQRGVVGHASLAPVTSSDLAAPTAQGEMQVARIERAAPAPAPAQGYAEGGVVSRTMPSSYSTLEVPPVGAIPGTAPASAPARPAAPQPRELQPLPTSQAPSDYRAEPVVGQATLPAGIFIQAGSFSQAENAHDLSQRLATLGRTSVKPVDIGGRTWYRVRLGPLDNLTTAHAALQDVQGMGVSDARVVRD